MLQTLRNAWSIPELRKKIIFTLTILTLYRVGNVIPVPFIDVATLANYFDSVLSTTIFGLMNAMSGSAFSQATVFALGIQPYINASIIIQLLTIAIPALERLAKEGGEEGKKKIERITRYTTVGLGLLMGLTMDVAMGAAGLNTLATLPVAFLRGGLLRLTCSKDSVTDGGVPSVYRLGVLGFVRYVVAAVVMHSLIYFTMECATFDYFHLTLLRVVVSGTVTVAIVYFASKIFNSQVARVL